MGILIFLLALMVHVIECETGLVLDSDYLYTYCQSCNLDIDDHDCSKNYSGNAGSMEVYNI